MTFNQITLILFLLLSSLHLNAQNKDVKKWTCGSDHLNHIENPYGKIPEGNMFYFDKKWKESQENNHMSSIVPDEEVLPIVFHIIHQNGVENISDALVLDAVSFLNQSFSNTGPYEPLGNNANVQFCLAKQDPNGQQTNGINRIESSLTSMTMETQDSDLKMLTDWPTSCYINVWIVGSITSLSSGPGVAGYATFPGSHGMFNDGIVMEAQFTGSNAEDNAVLTHEMGHYLGLYHTFQGGCQNNDCLTDGDRVCDTPPDESTSYIPCNSSMNTCSTDTDSGFPTDQDDLFMNFMDYSDLACYYLFTEQQVDRMHLSIDEARSSLLTCPSCITPCVNAVVSEFELSTTDGQVGIDINSINTSVNAVTYEWYINGSFFSNAAEPVFNFTEDGTYKIRLIATGADTNCLDIYEITIDISCNISLDITPSLTDCYAVDSLINFTFNDPDATDIEWFLNDVLVSTDFNYSESFEGGVYKITVHISNAECDRTVDFFLLIGCNEICGNGFDDDGDGLVDCYDPDCCEDCTDFYFDACFEDNTCPIEYDEFGITTKWENPQFMYPVYNIVGGDMDGDGTAEMVGSSGNNLYLNDHNGILEYTYPNADDLNGNMGPVIFDVDNDGLSEVYYITFDYNIQCEKLDGTTLFKSSDPFATFFTSLATFLFAADVNFDGTPEIIVGNDIYDATNGDLLVEGDDQVFSRGLFGASFTEEGHIVVANIIDDNISPGLEIIAGDMVMGIDIDNGELIKITEVAGFNDGAASVADWDRDGDLDVITVTSKGNNFNSRTILIWEGQTDEIIEEYTADFAYTSVPTVLNIDDDPELELVVNSLDGSFGQNINAFDNNLDEIWNHNVNELSNCPGIGFDFNGDGKNHLILRSMDFLEVIHGETGEILFNSGCGSITNNEHPIVLDIDNDGHAEIVTVCDGNMTAYEGFPEEWAPTRTMMHQYYFNNTLINDDMSIPLMQQDINLPNPNQGLNSAMTAYSKLKEADFYDFSLDELDYTCDENGIEVTMKGRMKSGQILAPVSLPYSIYTGNPAELTTSLYDTKMVNLDNTVVAGDEIEIVFQIPLADLDLFTSMEFCVIINDPGTQLPFNFENDINPDELEECKFEDNFFCADLIAFQGDPLESTLFICELDSLILDPEGNYADYTWNDGSSDSILVIYGPGTYWVEIENECGQMIRDSVEVSDDIPNFSLDLGPDTMTCTGGVFTFEADPGFDSYKWQDGTDTRDFTAWQAGKYWVEAVDYCGNVFIDTVELVYFEIEMDLIDTLDLCATGTYDVEAVGFERLLVNELNFPNCDDCNIVTLSTNEAGWVELIGINEAGCFAIDSIFVDIIPNPVMFDTAAICDIVFEYQDTMIMDPGDYVIVDELAMCDTIFNLHLMASPAVNITYDYEVNCDPLSANINVNVDGEGSFDYEWESGEEGPMLENIGPGVYTLTITNDQDCEIVWSETLPDLTDHTYSIADSFEIDINQSLDLTVLGDSIGADINWGSLPVICDSCFTNTISPENDTYVNIQILDEYGCPTDLTVFIRVVKERDFYTGNIFSPNDDGVNDIYYLQDGEHIASYDMYIYDRWGSQVFAGQGLAANVPADGWDGKFNGRSVTQGVYGLMLKVTFINGTEIEKFGSVTVVR